MNQGRALPLHRPLAVLAVGTGVLAVVLPAMALDDRQLLGVSVWLKPWKFAVSIAIYSLTVAWIVTLVGTGAHRHPHGPPRQLAAAPGRHCGRVRRRRPIHRCVTPDGVR